MSPASFIAAQRTDHGVPVALSCRALAVPVSTFYKQRNHRPTPTQRRRVGLDAAVRESFDASGGTYGSPRVLADLRDGGEKVSKKTVEASMARQGLQGRPRKARRGLTRSDKRAAPIPDLLRRDFTAAAINEKWVGDFKQINTDEGPVFLATVEDLFSRRMLGFAQSDRYPNAELATAAIHMAVATRGGVVGGVIFHTDKGTQYTSDAFAAACGSLKIANPWAASAAPWTTPQPNRSSRPCNTNASHGGVTAPETKPDETSPSGSTPGTTRNDATPPTP